MPWPAIATVKPHRPNPDDGDFPTPRTRPSGLARPAALMALGTTMSRLTGLGRVAALTFAVGVAESRLADSYNIANILPNVIYELVLGGVLTSVFIPVLVEQLRTRRRDDAWAAVSTMVATSMTVLVLVSAVTFVMAPWIVRIFTTRLTGTDAAQQQELATFFLRVFAPQIAFYGFAAIAGGLLNAHDRFAVPMFAPILNNFVVIATLLVFAALVPGTPTNATVGVNTGQKLLLGLGTTAGVVVMAGAHWPFVRRLPGRLRVHVDFRHPAVRKLARLSVWTLAYVVLNQIGFGVSLYLANQAQGGPTAYYTAFAFFQLPYGIAAVSIMTALVPTLAAQHVAGDDAGFREGTATGLRATALLLLPATVVYLVLSQPLIQTLLQHGVMRERSSALVADTLQMFALGLVPFSAFVLLLRAFYARQDTRTPLVLSVVNNLVTVILDFVLFAHLEVRGLALAHSLGYVVAAALAAVLLARRVGGLDPRRTLLQIMKVAAASLVAAGAMLLAVGLVDRTFSPGGGRALVQLLAGGVTGLGAFVFAAVLLGVEELSLLGRLLPRRR
jgi:putative peptidoglycan lipid II flippase